MNTNQRSTRLKPLQKTMIGVTLIEMMISLTIGLLIIAGIGFAFLASRQGFRSQDALARMQEGARTAFEIMDRDIRQASFRGCPPNTTSDINILTAASDWDKNLLVQPLIGYEKASGNWSAFPAGVTGVVGSVVSGDALTVLRADNSEEFIVASHNTGTSQITLTANHFIKQGAILVAAKDDCSRTAIFQKTNTCTISSGICNDAIVQHGSSSATVTAPLGSPAGTTDTFGSGSRIYRLKAATYYIGTNPANEPSLYREFLDTDGTRSSEELIEGVQDMQLSYGIDTTADGAVDSYVTAGSLTSATQWSQVLGIRINLLMVSRSDENGITTQPQQYSLDMNGDGDVSDVGETVTPTDHLLRKVFTTTIAVKNRL